MIEHWLPIAGRAGYEVSDFGRVRSKHRILKPSPRRSRKGGPVTHYAVNLGHSDLRRIHRLVLEAFVGPCPAGMQACHWDGNPANNRADNLRWDTPKANQADSVRHGTKSPPPIGWRGTTKRSWLNEDDIRCIRAEPYFRGVNQMLGRCFGVSYKTIERIRKAA